MQFPGPAFGMEGKAVQRLPAHEPVVDQVPATQVADRVPVNPKLHWGVQVVVSGELVTQFPTPELRILGNPAQMVLVQLPVQVMVHILLL